MEDGSLEYNLTLSLSRPQESKPADKESKQSL